MTRGCTVYFTKKNPHNTGRCHLGELMKREETTRRKCEAVRKKTEIEKEVEV
jgi:hypothetical protein